VLKNIGKLSTYTSADIIEMNPSSENREEIDVNDPLYFF